MDIQHFFEGLIALPNEGREVAIKGGCLSKRQTASLCYSFCNL